MAAERFLVRVNELDLARCGAGLQALQPRPAPVDPERSRAERDRARRDHDHLSAVGTQRSDVVRECIEPSPVQPIIGVDQ